MFQFGFKKWLVFSISALLLMGIANEGSAAGDRNCFKVLKQTTRSITIKNICSKTLQFDLFSGSKRVSHALLKRNRSAKFNLKKGKISLSACSPSYAKSHGGKCNKNDRVAASSAKPENATIAAKKAAAKPKKNKLKRNCVKLISATRSKAQFVNQCKQNVYFKFDGGGQRRVYVGTTDGTFFDRATNSYDLTGEVFYWKYCDTDTAFKTKQTCGNAFVYHHDTGHDHDPKANCLKQVIDKYPLGNMIVSRLTGLKNTCQFGLNFIYASKKSTPIRKRGLSSEGYPYMSAHRGKIHQREIRAGETFKLPKAFVEPRHRTLAAARASKPGELRYGACRGGRERGTYPYFTTSDFIFRCSIFDGSTGAIIHKVKHPNLD